MSGNLEEIRRLTALLQETKKSNTKVQKGKTESDKADGGGSSINRLRELTTKLQQLTGCDDVAG